MNSPLLRTPPRTTKSTKVEEDEISTASRLFALVGIGYLFPFSALTQPVDYWHYLFPDFNLEFALTTTYMYTNLIVLGLLVFGGQSHPRKYTSRIVGGFMGQLTVLLFVPTCYFFISAEHFMLMAMLGATATAAAVTAFLDSSVIALVTHYPLRVQETFQLGVGISTLIGSLYRDGTKLIFPPQEVVASSLLYFYTGAATIALCIGAYYRLMALKLTQECVDQDSHHEDDLLDLSETRPLLDATSAKVSQRPTKWSVLHKILFNEVLVSCLFASTLALWPPLVTEIPTYNFPQLEASGWWSLLLLTGFSIMDCIGRLLVPYRMGLNAGNIWKAILLRCVLLPLIVCCVRGIWFTNDLWSMLFVGLLGLTNGYLGTLSIIFINECITDAEQGIAGTFTSFFLNAGLVLGATLGLLLDALI